MPPRLTLTIRFFFTVSFLLAQTYTLVLNQGNLQLPPLSPHPPNQRLPAKQRFSWPCRAAKREMNGQKIRATQAGPLNFRAQTFES
ncbi:MAG TPA: hypothetical protein DER02_13070 [Gammaproteobacteria bacterium]|nr:hypothetical protein [Gammaproteobacteria bacterium]